MATHTTTVHTTQRSLLPYLIISVFVLFAGYIGFMVYGAMQSEVNLVSKDYYAEELAYSQRMKQVAQTQELKQPINVMAVPAAEQLVIQFPADLAKAKGTVHLFRPSDDKLDVVLPLDLNPEGLQLLNTAALKKGLWRVQLIGKVGEKEYYHVQDLTL
ncbi:FixH family protein [Rufibacter latericius]|uniref:Nitrogen fixation protein FixH n=1 Tax=Rufibacter latericius TaxID=2487040 RepID=A0A3M9M895_9BACT|nr:FixH family protein [Rufibacter latericius]RNI21800.1 nitrogen fixation protein FixH [Rufibacter latericius]